MTDAIILDPQEMAIAKRQCQDCPHWSWFEGCTHISHDPLPERDCAEPLIEEALSGLRSV